MTYCLDEYFEEVTVVQLHLVTPLMPGPHWMSRQKPQRFVALVQTPISSTNEYRDCKPLLVPFWQVPEVTEATFDFTRHEQVIVAAPSFHSHGACVQSAKLPSSPSLAGQKAN